MTSKAHNGRGFMMVWTVVLILTTTLWATPIVWIDAFGIFRKFGLPHAHYPARVWTRLAAAERATKACDVVLLGTSQVIFAFGAEPKRIGKQTVCNGALGGGTMYEIEQAARLILDETPPKHVYLFLDLIMFHDKRTMREDFAQSRLNPDRSSLTYYTWAALSFDAFNTTLKTLRIDMPWLTDNKMINRVPSAAVKSNMRAFLRWTEMYRDFEGPDLGLNRTRHVVEMFREHGVPLTLVLPPEHAFLMENIRFNRLWPVYRAWKEGLADVAASFEPAVVLWDFQTYHRASTSPIPLFPHDQRSPFWYDTIHSSELLGTYMIQRIADGPSTPHDDWDDNFGILLTPDNVESVLDNMAADRTAWITSNPRRIALYRSFVTWTIREFPDIREDWHKAQQRWNQSPEERLHLMPNPDPKMGGPKHKKRRKRPRRAR